MKKKTLGLLLITLLMIGLSGCGDINVYKKEDKQKEGNNKETIKIPNKINKDEQKEEKIDEELQKTLLENELMEIGRYFYEKYYYKNIQNIENENVKNFLAKYKDIGIKVDILNLANLPKYKEEIDKDFKNCDSKETKVIIHPKEPYGVTDYNITINLSCSFDKDLSE